MIRDLDVGRGGRPLPRITSTNRPFWDAARQHALKLPRCPACGQLVFPISTVCWACDDGAALEWVPVPLEGHVSSWVVYHRAFPPFLATDPPYAVVEVELDVGVRMIGATESIAFEDLTAGLPVRAAFRDATPDLTLVVFRAR